MQVQGFLLQASGTCGPRQADRSSLLGYCFSPNRKQPGAADRRGALGPRADEGRCVSSRAPRPVQEGALGVRRPDVCHAVIYALARGTHALHCSDCHTPPLGGDPGMGSLTRPILMLLLNSVATGYIIFSKDKEICVIEITRPRDLRHQSQGPCLVPGGLGAPPGQDVGCDRRGAGMRPLGCGGTGVYDAAAVGTRRIWRGRGGRCTGTSSHREDNGSSQPVKQTASSSLVLNNTVFFSRICERGRGCRVIAEAGPQGPQAAQDKRL